MTKANDVEKRHFRRRKEHHEILGRLLRNERLHPNRALLPEMLSMWLDAEGDDREMLRVVILNTFGNPKRIKWNEDEDGPMEAPNNIYERENTSEIRDVFDRLMFGKKETVTDAS